MVIRSNLPAARFGYISGIESRQCGLCRFKLLNISGALDKYLIINYVLSNKTIYCFQIDNKV